MWDFTKAVILLLTRMDLLYMDKSVYVLERGHMSTHGRNGDQVVNPHIKSDLLLSEVRIMAAPQRQRTSPLPLFLHSLSSRVEDSAPSTSTVLIIDSGIHGKEPLFMKAHDRSLEKPK